MNARHSITVLAVADFPRSLAFYGSVFRWETSVLVPGIWVEFVASPTHHIGLYARGGYAAMVGRPVAPPPPEGTASAAELYVIVDDLDEAVDRLRAAGAEETSPRAARPWGDEAAYFRDPDGNVIAVARPLVVEGR